MSDPTFSDKDVIRIWLYNLTEREQIEVIRFFALILSNRRATVLPHREPVREFIDRLRAVLVLDLKSILDFGLQSIEEIADIMRELIGRGITGPPGPRQGRSN